MSSRRHKNYKPESMCVGKKKMDREEAQRKAALSSQITGDDWVMYECPHCECYHIGHIVQSEKNARARKRRWRARQKERQRQDAISAENHGQVGGSEARAVDAKTEGDSPKILRRHGEVGSWGNHNQGESVGVPGQHGNSGDKVRNANK